MPEQVIVTSPEELMKKLSEPAVLPPPPAPSPRKVESPEELQRTMDWGAADFVLSENPVMPVPEHLAVEVPQPSVLGSRYYTVPPRGEWGRMGEMGFLESIGRMNPEEKLPGIGLGADIGRLLLVRAAADRVSKAQAAGKDVFKDRAFDEDLDTLRNTWLLHQYESARGQSWAGLGAEVLSEIPSFLVEMWASGGIAGAARVGAKKAVRKVVGNGLLRTAGQTGAGLLASGGARLATVGVPRVVKGYIERKNPQAVFDSAYKVRIEESKETHVSALYKAVGDTFIEYLSEESGEILGKLGGRAVRRLAAKSPKFAALNNAIRKAWSKVPGNKPSGWGQRLKKVGWHGIVEEMGEERLGDVLRSVLRVEDKTLGEALIPTGKQFMAELMSFGVMGGGFAGAGQVRQSVRTRRYRKALLSDGGAGAWALHNWEKAADLVDGESSSRKAFEAAGLPKMSGEERAAFLDQVTGFLRAAVEPAPATGQSGVEPEALAVDLTPEEMLRQQMEGAQQRIEGATARVRAEREGREEAEAQTEEKRQAIRDEFETLIGDSLDLEADLHRAFSEGDLDKAQELNSALVGMHQKARERFSGLDLSQLAQPIDPAMFVMQEAGQKTRDERRKAKEPGPEPAPQGYTRKQLNSKSRTFLAGLAKSRGIANPGSMNKKALIRALLKTPAAKPVEKPTPAPEPVKSKGLKPEAELNSLREQIQRAQEVLEEKPQFSGNKSFMARLAKLQDRYAELEAQQGRAPAEKPEAPESTAKWAAGIPVEKAKEPAGEDQGLAGEEAGSQENEIDKLEHYWTDPELVKELQEQASGGQGDLFDQKQDQKEPGGGASGNAMAAAVTSSLNVLPRNPDAIQDDRPKTKSRGRKTPPVSEPAAPGEAEETLGARFKRAMKTNTLVDGILHLLSPAHRGVALPGQEDAPALQVAKIKAASVAEMHRKDLVVAKLLHDAEKASSIKFRKMTNAEVADFVHAIETGQSLDIPELQVLADTLRNLLDEGRTQLQAIGKLQEFYENYFPHLFKDARKARDPIVAALSKRHLKPSGFLKQRKYLTVKEAMESNPDLELAHWNPLLIVAMHLHQVHRHLADHQIVQQLKARGLARFVAASLTKSYAPAGWVAVDDPSTQVVASPEISVQEAYDQLLADQLKGVLASLGITHERMATLGRPNLWGLSMTGQPRIKTKFAGPLSVLGHELGHQIGDIFGLYEYMRTGEHTQGKVIEKGKYKGQRSKSDAQKKRGNIDREFRALARLRAEGHDGQISKARLRYLMKQAEKEAVILEAWLAAPEKMERVAPEITKAWKEFLSAHERLKPLLHLNRSVVLGTASTTHKLPGVLNLGRWYVPAEVGTILENYLSPGFRGYKIAAVGSTYEWLRFVGAAMNQASLALSGFHAINVSTDAINTQMGLGFQQLFRLQLSKGLKNVVQSPLAPGTALMAGRKLLKAVQTPLNEIADPQMREMVEALVQAGGRAKMDPMYHNQMLQGLTTTMRELTVEGAGNKATAAVKLPFQTIFGAIELAAWPIMQYQVPALKLGCFQLLAKDIYAEAERKGWSDARRQGELMSAWSSVDNRMGQMTYDNLNWHRMLKEASMLVLRSAGWNLGSLREFGGALFVDLPSTPARILRGDDIITRRMGYAVGAGISYALQGALITYLLTGLWPWDDDDEEDTLSERLKDYYFPKTGNVNPDGTAERLGLPTYSRDIFSWFTRPWTTLKHKLHPLWGTIADLISNEDYYGTEIRDVKDPLPQQLIDMASHIGESFIPFSVRNYFRFREAGESRTQAFLQGASGITSAPKYITETPARKLLSEIAASKRSRGSRSREKAEYYRRRTQAIRGLRSGRKVDLSGFTSDQIKDIQRESKLTQLQSSFKRLSFEDAVSVFHLANAEERTQLFDLLLDKRVRTTSADDDVMQAYYALRLSQGEIDARRKADQQAAGKDLLRLSVAQRKGESEELYLQRLAEIRDRLKKNPEFDLDKHAVRALMRAAVKGSRFKTTMRAAAKGSRFKTTRMYRGLKLTPFGKLVRKAELALGL